MVELVDLIRELRREPYEAALVGVDEPLRLELGPVELEVTVGVERQGSADARLRFWVVELGATGQETASATQRLKLTLQPRLAGSAETPWIAGRPVNGEK